MIISSGIDFRGKLLRGENFRGQDLSGASFLGARLDSVDFAGASLRHADFRSASLHSAILQDADMDNALFGLTVVSNINLVTSQALEKICHYGPTSIDVGTLVKSSGRIPETFLQGCGMTPWQILDAKMYNPTLTHAEMIDLQMQKLEARMQQSPLAINGIFLSYSSVDVEFARKLRRRLIREGLSVWMDEYSLNAGGLQRQIDRAIRVNDVVVVALSQESIKSAWVENELEMAWNKEQAEGRDVLCPVALDDSWQIKMRNEEPNRVLWRRLKEKIVLDFSGWKTTRTFKRCLEKLIHGLKSNYGW